VRIEIHGIRALRVGPVGTRIELPKFCDANGLLRTAVVLPEEVRAPMGDIVLDTLVDRGLAVRRFLGGGFGLTLGGILNLTGVEVSFPAPLH
jgi:hypothetical protein